MLRKDVLGLGEISAQKVGITMSSLIYRNMPNICQFFQIHLLFWTGSHEFNLGAFSGVIGDLILFLMESGELV